MRYWIHHRNPALILALMATATIGISIVHADGFSYDRYAEVLSAHVDDNGMVNYRALQAGRTPLDAFVQELARIEPAAYERWSNEAKVAFWINTYNALTLEAIIDHYPIKASRLRSLRFPKNSIRQIPGVWTKLKFSVMGEERTLDEIEHKILRARFNEPRIHMALVCAAMSCPSLRNEPYVAERLGEQLNDQAHRFVQHPARFRIDRAENRVYLSPILKWFGEDFVPSYGTDTAYGKYDRSERAVLNFISRFLSPEDQNYLKQSNYSIKYFDYDWSLNEQQTHS